MVLGTVEIGMDYGINNSCGKPSIEEAYDLLDTAWNNGILELDTAAAYGNSEEIIGHYQETSGHKFLVDTKLPVSIDVDSLEKGLYNSCKRLKTDKINLLYLHSFQQCKHDDVLNFLLNKKKEKIIRSIGISIYEPTEMKYIIDQLPFIDTIQFPFNVLDCHRWIDDGLLDRAKQRGKKLYTRSVFLQGLLFKSSSDDFVRSIGAGKYIELVGTLAKNNGYTISEMAYKYVSQTSFIDEMIIGCQGENELMMNVSVLNSEKMIDECLISALNKISHDIPMDVIDPRKWRV